MSSFLLKKSSNVVIILIIHFCYKGESVMRYQSTRGNYKAVESAEAIKTGMVPVGGLFVPESIPTLDEKEMDVLVKNSYPEICQMVFSKFLTDFSAEELKKIIGDVYNDENFDSKEIAPIVKLSDNKYILELWHGPTAAFKDMALQMLPKLMETSIKKLELENEVLILVATSGDTGKAALEGFKNIDGIKIICLYPHEKVSKVQELQMTTTGGDNTNVIAIRGNFDDCQSKVKEIFGDMEFREELLEKNVELSSANSINWGRLLPQIVYYFKAYGNLLSDKEISMGEKINVVVPTGNFGNILAAWYAGEMGLPINKLICASNVNNILSDFIKTGVYDKNRDFIQTNSPSMDILVSSNLERFLFEISGHDADKISDYMNDLNTKGVFKVDSETLAKIKAIMSGGFADEAETFKTIKETFEKENYTLDTHTAVALNVYEKYVQETGDSETKTIIDSTANPYKFNKSVLEAISGKEAVENKTEFVILEELEELTKMEIHRGLKNLDKMQVLHKTVADTEELPELIKDFINK